MTLANNYNPTKQLANGVTTSFTFNYDMINEDYAAVYQEVDGVQTLVDPDLYTVEFNNNGGNVIFKTAPAAGVYIVIGRSVPLDQETPYKTSSGFPANRVEENLDKLTAITQQLADESERSPKIPLGTAGVDLNLPAPDAGKALVWNQEATALINSNINIDASVDEITAQADRAENEADAAANSATAALNSQNAAAASENLAEQWAVKMDGMVNNEDYSAKYYAQDALDSAKKLKNAVFGNIGDIKYTSRTDVPNGGAWCDGAEYTQAMFPDIYQMLVNGKISSTDYTTFDNSVSTNGSCGFFALDTATTSFKVPLLKDVYIKAEQAPLMFGAESLPNIIGDTGYNWGGSWNPSGAFGSAGGSDSRYGGTSGQSSRVNFDASRVSSTYQDGAKVNPDHVVYRAYVVLYSSAAEASVAQAQEFMTALGGKANVGLDNITAEAKDLVAGLCMPSDQYIDLDLQASGTEYIAPDNGYYFLYMSATSNGQYVGLFNIKNSGGGTADENINYGVLSSDFAGINPMVMLPVKKGDIVMVWYNAPTKKIFRFIYAEGSKE